MTGLAIVLTTAMKNHYFVEVILDTIAKEKLSSYVTKAKIGGIMASRRYCAVVTLSQCCGFDDICFARRLLRRIFRDRQSGVVMLFLPQIPDLMQV